MTVLLAVLGPLVFVDPGHGGDDPGAVGPSGVRESDVVLSIGFDLYTYLTGWCRAYLSRRKDIRVPLADRVKAAESLEADVFVSIHCNGAENLAARGCEVLYFPGSETGEYLAQVIQKRLVTATGLRDRGIKPRPGLYVLSRTSMPAILVECAFVTNPEEENLLKDFGFHRRVAGAINDGLRNVLTEGGRR